MSTHEKENKLKSLQSRAQAAEAEVKRLKQKIEKSVLRLGVQLDQDLHDDLTYIMESNNATVLEDFPPGM